MQAGSTTHQEAPTIKGPPHHEDPHVRPLGSLPLIFLSLLSEPVALQTLLLSSFRNRVSRVYPLRNNDLVLPAMSSLKDVYDRFAKQPNVDDFYDDATLSYISSGTNVKGANEIVQFILRSRNDVQITENVLAYHIGHNSLTVEVAAECKFKNGPSWIVPGVDPNMLDGVLAKLPLVSQPLLWRC